MTTIGDLITVAGTKMVAVRVTSELNQVMPVSHWKRVVDLTDSERESLKSHGIDLEGGEI